MHDVVSDHLDERELRRAGGDRQCGALHLRQPRRGRRRATAHLEHTGRCLALPYDLQLHRCLSEGHQGHEYHRGRQAHATAGTGVNRRRNESDRRSGMEQLWTWLSTPPAMGDVLDLFGALYLLLFAPGYLLSAYLAGPGADRLAKDPLQLAGIKHWASTSLWVFGAGLFFFG